MLYSGIVLIASYDTWKDGIKMNLRAVRKMKSANKEKIVKLLADVIKQIGERDWDKEIENLKV